MRVHFVPPELPRLDAVKSDAFTLFLHHEDWPLRGAAGLVDWRVGGQLSRLRESGWITCDLDEVVLMPLTNSLPFDKLLLIGMGSIGEGVTGEHVASGLHRAFVTLEKMGVRGTVLQLPGRPDHLEPDQAMEILLDVARGHPSHDELVVVEAVEAHEAMEKTVERRRSVDGDQPEA